MGSPGIGIGDGLVYTGADGDLEVQISPQSTLALISIILSFLFFCSFFNVLLTNALALSDCFDLVPTNK